MNPDADVAYHTVHSFSLTNVLSTSFLMFHITFDEISTTLVCGILVMVDVLDTYGD